MAARRGALPHELFLWCCPLASPLGFLAVLAGWTTTEVGRQPWTVYGLLRTADSVSPSLTGPTSRLIHRLLRCYLFMFPPASAHVQNRPARARRGDIAPEHRKRPAARDRSRRSRDRNGAATMNQPVPDLVPLWALILGGGDLFYVVFDGFDLGVGILFGLAPDTHARNLVMNSIAPVWDGNETWLVLGGVALLAAFPLAFAVLLPAVYFPILIMLLALVFRGVAFEFRYRDAEQRTFWDHAFNYGSIIGAFAQGIVLGAFIQGFRGRAHSPAARSTASRRSRC